MALAVPLITVVGTAFLVVVLGIEIGGIMNSLTPYIEKIPWVGGQIANAVTGMAQAISNKCGQILAPIDHAVGSLLHSVARLVDWTYGEFRRNASLLLQTAETVTGIAAVVAGVRALAHLAHSIANTIAHRFVVIGREIYTLGRRLDAIERQIARGIGNDVLPRIKTLEREVANVEGKVIPAIEGAETALQNDVTALGEYIRANYLSSATDAVTAAVAVALGALGLGGLRCNTLLRSLTNRGCGLWQGLEDLLGLLIDAIALTHLCDLPTWIEELFSPLLGDLTSLISSAANSLCAQANPKWAKFSVTPGPQPPPQSLYIPQSWQ